MNTKKKFNNKIVIITGASSGIGKATAFAFAREGATTILAARSLDKLEAVAEEIRRFNPQVRVFQTDVTSQVQVQNLVEVVATEFGKIDVLVNNAGSGAIGPVDKQSPVYDPHWDV